MNVFIHEAINTTKGQKEDLNFSILKNRTPKDVVQQTRCFLTFQQQKKEKQKLCAKLELFGENQIGAWRNLY